MMKGFRVSDIAWDIFPSRPLASLPSLSLLGEGEKCRGHAVEDAQVEALCQEGKHKAAHIAGAANDEEGCRHRIEFLFLSFLELVLSLRPLPSDLLS